MKEHTHLRETVVRVYKPHTTLEDGSTMNWDESPNNIQPGRSRGESLLTSAPLGTLFIQSNGTVWCKGPTRWRDINTPQLHPKTIVPYWGRLTDLEEGWVVCDGTRGTPDLRERMIIGATSDQDLGTIKVNKVNLSVTLPILTQTAPDAVRLHWITYNP